MTIDQELEQATQFIIGRDNTGYPVMLEARDQRDGPRRWCVKIDSQVLRKSGVWECEPMPSSRTEAFFKRTRFASTAEARAVYAKMVSRPKYRAAGWTIA